MFNDSKYTKWYTSIINNAHSLSREKGVGIYYEEHHALPRCVGGDDSKENLVLLTAREHFLCHILLTRMATNYAHYAKFAHALWCMSNGRVPNKTEHLLHSARWYERVRKRLSRVKSETMIGENNPFFGKTHSEELKNRCFRGDANPSKRLEVRAKMRGPRPGQIRGAHSDERRNNISKALMGHRDTDETRAKKREAKQDLVWRHTVDGKTSLLKRDDAERLGPEWLPGRGKKTTA